MEPLNLRNLTDDQKEYFLNLLIKDTGTYVCALARLNDEGNPGVTPRFYGLSLYNKKFGYIELFKGIDGSMVGFIENNAMDRIANIGVRFNDLAKMYISVFDKSLKNKREKFNGKGIIGMSVHLKIIAELSIPGGVLLEVDQKLYQNQAFKLYFPLINSPSPKNQHYILQAHGGIFHG
jgi:hypothetical protein